VGVGSAAEEAAFYLVAAGVGRVLLEAGLMARHGERLSELNPGVELAASAIGAIEVRPLSELRRAEGARAALMALLELSGAANYKVWRDDAPPGGPMTRSPARASGLAFGRLNAFLDSAETRKRLEEHVRAWFPREACALIVGSDDALTLELVDNLADTFHAADPEAFPRTAETAFVLDARAILRAEREGRRLVAIVHSHPDGTLAFSAEDRRLASTPDGRFPLYPEAFHVVLGAADGRVETLAVYGWSSELADFVRAERVV